MAKYEVKNNPRIILEIDKEEAQLLATILSSLCSKTDLEWLINMSISVHNIFTSSKEVQDLHSNMYKAVCGALDSMRKENV